MAEEHDILDVLKILTGGVLAGAFPVTREMLGHKAVMVRNEAESARRNSKSDSDWDKDIKCRKAWESFIAGALRREFPDWFKEPETHKCDCAYCMLKGRRVGFNG